jgi:hypothetical protein
LGEAPLIQLVAAPMAVPVPSPPVQILVVWPKTTVVANRQAINATACFCVMFLVAWAGLFPGAKKSLAREASLAVELIMGFIIICY